MLDTFIVYLFTFPYLSVCLLVHPLIHLSTHLSSLSLILILCWGVKQSFILSLLSLSSYIQREREREREDIYRCSEHVITGVGSGGGGGGGGGGGAMGHVSPTFLIGGGGWAMVCLCPPPFNPTFLFSTCYITLTNNYLAFFIYQLIILQTISIN